jgi:hypothetical protein
MGDNGDRQTVGMIAPLILLLGDNDTEQHVPTQLVRTVMALLIAPLHKKSATLGEEAKLQMVSNVLFAVVVMMITAVRMIKQLGCDESDFTIELTNITAFDEYGIAINGEFVMPFMETNVTNTRNNGRMLQCIFAAFAGKNGRNNSRLELATLTGKRMPAEMLMLPKCLRYAFIRHIRTDKRYTSPTLIYLQNGGDADASPARLEYFLGEGITAFEHIPGVQSDGVVFDPVKHMNLTPLMIFHAYAKRVATMGQLLPLRLETTDAVVDRDTSVPIADDSDRPASAMGDILSNNPTMHLYAQIIILREVYISLNSHWEIKTFERTMEMFVAHNLLQKAYAISLFHMQSLVFRALVHAMTIGTLCTKESDNRVPGNASFVDTFDDTFSLDATGSFWAPEFGSGIPVNCTDDALVDTTLRFLTLSLVQLQNVNKYWWKRRPDPEQAVGDNSRNDNCRLELLLGGTGCEVFKVDGSDIERLTSACMAGTEKIVTVPNGERMAVFAKAARQLERNDGGNDLIALLLALEGAIIPQIVNTLLMARYGWAENTPIKSLCDDIVESLDGDRTLMTKVHLH